MWRNGAVDEFVENDGVDGFALGGAGPQELAAMAGEDFRVDLAFD